jgi:hypothetical protein
MPRRPANPCVKNLWRDKATIDIKTLFLQPKVKRTVRFLTSGPAVAPGSRVEDSTSGKPSPFQTFYLSEETRPEREDRSQS